MNKKKTSPKKVSAKEYEKIIRETSGAWKDRKDLDEFFSGLRKSMNRRLSNWNR